MPELPEVETVRRGLAAVMVGRPIVDVLVRRGDLRRPLPEGFAAALTGRTVRAIDRRAKYLLFRLDDGTVVIAHLGMSGRMVIEQASESQTPGAFTQPSVTGGKHEHIVFSVGNGTQIRFSDPRRFGLMDLATEETLAEHPLLASIGPEPLDDAFDGAALAARLAGKRNAYKIGSAGPAHRRGARQYLCLRRAFRGRAFSSAQRPYRSGQAGRSPDAVDQECAAGGDRIGWIHASRSRRAVGRNRLFSA